MIHATTITYPRVVLDATAPCWWCSMSIRRAYPPKFFTPPQGNGMLGGEKGVICTSDKLERSFTTTFRASDRTGRIKIELIREVGTVVCATRTRRIQTNKKLKGHSQVSIQVFSYLEVIHINTTNTCLSMALDVNESCSWIYWCTMRRISTQTNRSTLQRPDGDVIWQHAAGWRSAWKLVRLLHTKTPWPLTLAFVAFFKPRTCSDMIVKNESSSSLQ